MPDNYAALVEHLGEIKKRNGYTIGQMAEMAGVNPVTLWRVMHGQRRPSFDTTTALLRTFPQLADLFLPADTPLGNEPVPDGIPEPQTS